MRTKFVGLGENVWDTASGRDVRKQRRVEDEDVSLLRSGRNVIRMN